MLRDEKDNFKFKGYSLSKTPIISFLNYKGGVGKTNVSVNFAYHCAVIEKKKTLLIDWDPQGDSTEYIGVGRDNVKETMFEFLVNNHKPIVGETVSETPYENLFLIGANSTLKNIETYITNDEDAFEVFRDHIISFSEYFDIIIIDCPPANSHINIASIFASTDIFIITTSSSDSIDKIGLVNQMVGNIVDVIKENIDENEIGSIHMPTTSGVILTMAIENTVGLDVAREHLKDVWGELLISPAIPRTVSAAYSVSENVPLLHSRPKSKLATRYKEVFKEVLSRVN